MTRISLDFSKRDDLRWLGELLAAFQEAAGATPFLVVGATARDLLLHHAQGIHLFRATDDVDVAFVADGWGEFSDLKKRLLAAGAFTEVPRIEHRVIYRGSRKVDLVPFGGIEGPNRSIAWPPDGDTVMNVFGFREVLAGAIEIKLPGDVQALAPSLAGLAVIKLIAWDDRRDRVPGSDAYDLEVILRNYPPPGNEERLVEEAEPLLEEGGFDYEIAGAWLLGRDMARLLPPDSRPQLVNILSAEANPVGRLRLVGDMKPRDPARGLALVQAVTRGFQGL